MAKRRQVKRSTGRQARLPAVQERKPVDLPMFSVENNLSLDDVLSIVVSRAERRYTSEIDKCLRETRDLNREISDVREEIKQLHLSALKKAEEKRVRILTEQLSEFGLVVTVQATGEPSSTPLTGSLSFSVPNTYGAVNCQLSVPVPAKMANLLALLEDLKASLAVAEEEALGWKRRLANIPMLERIYKGKIAEEKLRGMEGGQQMLDLLEENLEETMLNLPGS